ncbi:ribonuclease E inhibitor RraA/Dimethylmenaquinone methyltransferase [Helicostylum pulchrum]|uniref:RraA-like protein n=1 Tax=Helicostylum pulchrum TaxID=562976 RepID=A0ABP9XKR0_9FUNG|nr:ribonuclease E inhibitor RraA/Dimethylmenaquinone methyltransferase [Helicostylum pulchrum]
MTSSLEELKKYSTCEIADALLKLGQGPWGGYIPDIELWSPAYCQGDTRIVGPAFTVKMVEKSDTTSPTPKEHFVDAAHEGSIIVISAPPDVKNAVWGGLMSARAKAKGVKGVVIDGRVRDLSEHRAMNFAVFARSHSILPQNAFVRPSQVQVPITLSTISPVVVHPSDIIVADLDGIICVPKDSVDAVILNCAKYVAIDDLCMKDIQQGKGVKETFAKHRGT